MPRDVVEPERGISQSCSCLRRMLPLTRGGQDYFEAQSRVNVANMEHPDGSVVCKIPCRNVLATLQCGLTAVRFKRPFSAVWNDRYNLLPILLACVLASLLMPTTMTWWLP